MAEVISVKFKGRGKCYFFDPGELKVQTGDKVIIETSKGIEIAECVRGNHNVPDEAVVPPLRPVIRVATAEDRRTEEYNRQREREAYRVCQQKIAEHGLDMKLVDVECNFEGSKTLFFFTSDGRVDFRELVKDLASVFRNRIELRQIGVRDEAKMIGGIGICGRPYCCSQFLEDFQPVSTKMAKLQSLSLNPTKISGSCGRLMCCLRYEQDAYEDLVKKVPKQGAYVETKDGFGTAVQVNLLRQTVQVRLDKDGDETARSYKANELCAVPGGRPKDGEEPVSTFVYVPEPEETEEPEFAAEAVYEPPVSVVQPHAEAQEPEREGRRGGSRRRGRVKKEGAAQPEHKQESPRPQPRKPETAEAKEGSNQPETRGDHRRRGRQGRPHEPAKTVKVEAKPVQKEPKPEKKPQPRPEGESVQKEPKPRPHRNNRRRYHNNSGGTGKPQSDNK